MKKRLHSGGQSFLHGALILTGGMVLVKAVGALFKIPLASVIGADGMGYFNTAYVFYSVFFSLATAGFPVAIAKLTAENYSLKRYNDLRQIRRAAKPIFIVGGLIGTAVMLCGAYAYTVLFLKNPGALLPTLYLAPSVLFCCLSSVFRGYYEGLRNMYPTAVSEIIEALSKLVFGLSAAAAVFFLCEKEYNTNAKVFGMVMGKSEASLFICSCSAAAAIFGVTVGSLLSFLYLFLYYRRRGDGITEELYRSSLKPHSLGYSVKKLISVALPIAVSSVAANITGVIDVSFLQGRLNEAVAKHPQVIMRVYEGLIPELNLKEAASIPNFLYGCYSCALTLFMLVPAITQAFGISALPNLAGAWAQGRKAIIKSSIESIIKLSAIFAIPAGLGLSVLSEPCSALLYGSGGAGKITARALIVLGFAAIPAALNTPLGSMLQAMGRADIPLKFILLSLLIKLSANYFLCGIAEINILGAGLATLLSGMFLTTAELIALRKVSGVKMQYSRLLLKPLLCSVFSSLSAFAIYSLLSCTALPDRLSCVLSIGTSALIYMAILLISKTVTKNDILTLPKGEKIIKILEK